MTHPRDPTRDLLRDISRDVRGDLRGISGKQQEPHQYDNGYPFESKL